MPKFLGPAVLSVFALFVSGAPAQTSSTTSVTAVPAASAYGTSTSITAGVAPATQPFVNPAGATVLPTGTVQFLDGTTALGSATPLTPGSGFTLTPFDSVFADSSGSASLVGNFQTSVDLNGDGKPDLLLSTTTVTSPAGQTSASVQAYLSTTSGTFASGAIQTLTLPAAPPSTYSYNPVVADLNSDGKPDILIGNAVAYGNGDGTFQQPVTLASVTLPSGIGATFAADVTGDGKPDILAINAPDAVPPGDRANVQLQVTVFSNQGGGNFQALGTYTLATGSYLSSATLASLHLVDLNGDGKLDMVSEAYLVPEGNAAAPATIAALLNNGDGTFAAAQPVTYSLDYTQEANAGAIELDSLQVADFDGDGKADLGLVYTSQFPQGAADLDTPLLFLHGNGDGTFGSQVYSLIVTKYADTTAAPALALAPTGQAISIDANLDGHLDIAFGSGAILDGNGAGGFTSGSPITPLVAGSVSTAAPQASIGVLQTDLSVLPAIVYAPTSTSYAFLPAVATHNLTSSAALAAMTLSVGTHSITASYSGDSNYSASTSAPAVVTISSATPTVTATSSANPAYVGESVSFAISVASAGSTPTGTVVLSNGSTQLGTGTLDGTGKATISASFATAGSATLTATYSGDTTHTSATATVNQTVVAAFTVAAGGGSTTITVPSGQSASAQLSLTGGANFAGSVSLSCSGLPSTASCSFNPATLNLSGNTAQNTTLTVSTGGSTTAKLLDPFSGRGMTLTCAFFAGGLLLWPRKRRPYWAACLLVGITLLPIGCGGNSSSSSSNNNTPAGTYAFKVVATAGAMQTTTDYTLTVQ